MTGKRKNINQNYVKNSKKKIGRNLGFGKRATDNKKTVVKNDSNFLLLFYNSTIDCLTFESMDYIILRRYIVYIHR
jgi:hypothetical protein